MSKNFELLQQICKDTDVFSTSDVACENAMPNSARDDAAREAILKASSLPNVLETSKRPDGLNASLVPGTKEVTIEAQTVSGDTARGNGWRNSRFASGLSESSVAQSHPRVARHVPNQNPLTVGSGDAIKEETKVHYRGNAAVPNVFIAQDERFRPPKSRSHASLLDWAERVTAPARNWASKLYLKPALSRSEREVIVREEEMKLVHTVFPQNTHGTPRVALFAGLEADSGCAAVCARTAELLAARADGNVCVVDANFGSPSLHRYFFVQNRSGLAEAALDSGPITNFADRLPGSYLWLISSGQAAPSLNFSTYAEKLKARIAELRATFRYIVIHAAPLRLDSSSLFVSAWTDGVVLVLEANSARRDSARRAKESLSAARVPLLGVVLNNRSNPIPGAFGLSF